MDKPQAQERECLVLGLIMFTGFPTSNQPHHHNPNFHCKLKDLLAGHQPVVIACTGPLVGAVGLRNRPAANASRRNIGIPHPAPVIITRINCGMAGEEMRVGLVRAAAAPGEFPHSTATLPLPSLGQLGWKEYSANFSCK